MSLFGQLIGQDPRRLRRPPQRRLGIPPGDRVYQLLQRLHQPRVRHRDRLPAAALTADPTPRLRLRSRLYLRHPLDTVGTDTPAAWATALIPP